MDRSAIEKIIRATYAARVANDLESTLRPLAEDAYFHIAGASHVCGAARRVGGAAEVRNAIAALFEVYEFIDQSILDFLVDGDQAAVRTRVKLRFRPTGETL